MKKRLPVLIIALLLTAVSLLAMMHKPQGYYPSIEFSATAVPANTTTSPAEAVNITFLFDAQPTIGGCEALIDNTVRTVLANCPACRIGKSRCTQTLDASEQAMLSELPLETFSGRMSTGVVIFTAANAELAQAVCQQTESQSLAGPQPVKCFAPHTQRTRPVAHMGMSQIALSFLALAAAAIAAWLVCWLILKYEHLHAHLSHDHIDAGPQKFHAVPTPRIGGIGLMAGLLAAGGVIMVTEKLPHEIEFGLLLLASLPAFLGGLMEDITKKVGVLERLLLTMLAGSAAAWLLGAVLVRLDVPGIDQALTLLFFAVPFTSFAVGGIANAINIIDGFNGLVGGYAIIVLIALAIVAGQVGDSFVFTVAIASTGAILGFLKWNWPGGKIFLGDGGAYLVGYLLAELSILLVARNPGVSPWFPLVLLIYPVFETFFSIYRKLILRRQSPGKPDGLHFHMLIYRRAVPRETGYRRNMGKLERNNRVAKYLWIPTAIVAVAGVILWQSTLALAAVAILFCVGYVIFYWRIIRMGATNTVMSGRVVMSDAANPVDYSNK